ncbi:GH39 family glycosyl hydrolase [Streptomyces sp. TRM68416]|uniref:GH39 family glycosyl hydrolase n=1 Tax=Streptomyces sp. TRM68416 TaxID=2758412 RepID=UPI001661B8FB|nr:xylan 1,4-beta-xylosidase [Streptomyces sp. TRM68416]MBD0838078.1 xylan 1,4-beta-xylosidase [Streptomyces sp. TRM68416]
MGRHGWNSGARRWRFTALLGVGVVALALVVTLLATLPGNGGDTKGTSPDGDKVHGTPAATPAASVPEVGWGFTHTQYSADEGDGAAVARVEKRIEDAGGLPQIQHVMGWGASNPEPVKGRYDFAAMDRRIDFVRASGSIPVVTLCCAPDWMKGGEPGVEHTDWSQAALETAPDPEHFDDYAALAATVAKRYPDVRHFIVWNEFKGFWNDAEARWDHEGYTRLYNEVYRALKEVDPDIMVGGPYLVMDSLDPREAHASPSLKGRWGALDQRVLDAFAYWNEHKAGADFVVVDGSSYTRDDELLPDEFTATDKFTAVGEWVRRQTGDDLPLWWAEYYVEPADADDEREGWSESRRVAVQAAGMIALARGGATSGFYWNPQNEQGTDCPGCLWTPTDSADGGRKLPMFDLVSRFNATFPPGTAHRPVTASADVRVLATDKTALVVNTRDRQISTKIDGRTVKLQAYEVRWLERPAT